MNFSDYKNSILLPDQSAWQQAEYWITESNINVFSFLSSQNVSIKTTSSSARELSFQSYVQNLFVNDLSNTASELNSKESFVLSSINGSLTFEKLSPLGFPAQVIPDKELGSLIKSNQFPLWDSSPFFLRMKRNRRSQADIEHFYLGRYLQKNKQPFFVFTNDDDQIRQAQLEGFKFMRPPDLLVWMVKDTFVTRQKAVWAYEKAKKHNARWAKAGLRFRDILNKCR